jgi:Protein of unknown function (DUF4238)
MASYKNQHFVPRCHLKPFSLKEESLAINLFNIDRQQGIRNAPIKGQCSGDYFYGEDLRLERVLQHSEGLYAKAIKEIRAPNYELTSRHKTVLQHFSYLQYCRTDATSRRAAMFMTEMTEVAFKGDVPQEYQTSMREAVQAGMHAFAKTMNVVYDLKVCLVRNRTSLEFATSDNPSVLTNRWYAQKRVAKGLSGGVGSAGAMFLLPIAPETLCIIYDGDVYTAPNDNGWVVADKRADVEALNEHQYLNCQANIYFSDWNALDDISNAFATAQVRRPRYRHEVVTAVLEKEDAWGQEFRVVPRGDLPDEGQALVHIKTIYSVPSRWPSFIRFRDHPRVYTNESGTGFVRKTRAEAENAQFRSRPYRKI